MYKDKAQHKAFMKQWYLDNKDKVRAATKQYDATHRAERNAARTLRRKSPKGQAYYHAWYEKNRARYLLQQSTSSHSLRIFHRMRIFEFLGGALCKKCGFDDYRALQIDHIAGGGNQEFKNNPSLLKPTAYFKLIQKDPTRYQVLCANCNWIKRSVNRELANVKPIQ